MPAISKFRGIIVRLMKLPHRGLTIYAHHGEEEIVMDAGTLKVISGSAPARFVELVQEWAYVNDADLQKALHAVHARRAPSISWTSHDLISNVDADEIAPCSVSPAWSQLPPSP